MQSPSDLQPWHVLRGFVCQYCGEGTELCNSALIYGRSYGPVYRCAPCRAWVGVHKNSGPKSRVLGRLANAELRRWKQAAHAFFDPLWKAKPGSRAAYVWLAREIGIPPERTHVGMFNVAQCQRVIELCKAFVGGKGGA